MAAAGVIDRLRAGVDRRVAALCTVIFLADVVGGILVPTFSPFAQGLGLSLAAIGAINTIGGATQLAASVPLGIVSDRLGRARVITSGLLGFALTMSLFAAAGGAPLLIVGRMLLGVTVVACFHIGSAYLGDITEPGRRSVAFGAYTTAMGLGYSAGPLLGGQIADRWSARAAYLFAIPIALAGAALAYRVLRDPPRAVSVAGQARWYAGIRDALGRADLLVVSFGNLLVNVTFAGAISTFFPIYAKDAGLTAATIGSLYALRSFVSALGRLPNSAITRVVGDQPVLLGAMGVQALVLFGVSRTDAVVPLALLLGLEGLAYGAYLVAGQTWIADHTESVGRGAAVGLYSAFGSLGGIVAPLTFGVIAERYSVRSVFLVNGWVMLAGLAVSIAGTLLVTRSMRPKAAV